MLQVLMTPLGGALEDVTGYLTEGRFEIGRSLGGAGAACNFSLSNFPGRPFMATVTALWNGDPVYQGQFMRRRRRSAGPVMWLTPECTDAVDRMKNILVAEIYTNASASDIILDLLTRYMPSVTPSVAPIPLLLDLAFPYVTLFEAIRRVTETVGAYWHLAPDNTLRVFTSTYDLGPVPAVMPQHIQADSLEEEVTMAGFANRVWVLGARQAGPEYKVQEFSGVNNVFGLAYEPNYTEVRVNGGALRTVHLKSNVQGGTEFVVDKKAKTVTPLIDLAPTDTVQIRYRPTVEIVDFFEDPASVATYGLYETVIKDRTIIDKASARQRGRSALRRSAGQQPIYRWRSDTLWQLYPGQRITLSDPQFEIDHAPCRITDATWSFQWVGHRWVIVASLTAEGLAA